MNKAVSEAGKASASAVNSVIDSVARKVRNKKRPHYPPVQEQSLPLKKNKIDIDSLFNGSGIVYD